MIDLARLQSLVRSAIPDGEVEVSAFPKPHKGNPPPQFILIGFFGRCLNGPWTHAKRYDLTESGEERISADFAAECVPLYEMAKTKTRRENAQRPLK